MLSLPEALSSLEQGLFYQQPQSADLLLRILQRCRKERNPEYAQRLLRCIRRSELELHISLCRLLVPMLAEAGCVCDAQHVFDMLCDPNEEGLWNSLIAGYVRHGQPEQALSLYAQMQEKSVHPNSHTFVPALSACAKLKDIHIGGEIHAEAARHGLEAEVHVGATLVDMYVKCDLPFKAQEVFNKLTIRSVVSWNTLIAGYATKGLGDTALNCFKEMQLAGFSPNSITYVCSLKACGSIGAMEEGQAIHHEISKTGLDCELFVASALVDMYMNFGFVAKAEAAFEKLVVRDVVSWTSLIRGYAEHDHGKEALQGHQQMQLEGISPNTHTFVCTLKACGSVGAIVKGQELHASVSAKLLEGDPFIRSAVIDMYTKLGLFAKAQEMFDNLHCQEVVSWNAMIAGYVKHGHCKEALDCYARMKGKGLPPNIATFASTLKACSSIGAIDLGRAIHTEALRSNLAADLVVGSALVDMYANCGLLYKAQEVFDKLVARNVISWTALISGYVKHGANQEAINCFDQMEREGVLPEASTLVCMLKACGLLGASGKGQAAHALVARKSLDRELILGSTLVDMYANCGLLASAQEVFDGLAVRDAASWNALLVGYAQLGDSNIVFRSFDKMGKEGHIPTVASLISVLNVCSHVGLVDLGKTFFNFISKIPEISLTLQHLSCLVDLLGRSGLSQESFAVITTMPFLPNLVVWHTMLGGVRKSNNVELGKEAFEQAIELDSRDTSAYIYMYNIYLDAEMQEDALRIQTMRLKNITSSESMADVLVKR
ncbi:hypothetical protein GOP47_0027033 [Adiantum capillus-veneris]|nr:hypothetical protein GOP47_0027033 [Adiantum capillus-veneris]